MNVGLSGGKYVPSNPGSIRAEPGNLISLTRLSLSDNQLTGPIPAKLDSPTNLTHLYLSANQLKGCIPPGLKHIANNDLDRVDLSCCGQGQAPAATDFNCGGKTDFVGFFLVADAFGSSFQSIIRDSHGPDFQPVLNNLHNCANQAKPKYEDGDREP